MEWIKQYVHILFHCEGENDKKILGIYRDLDDALHDQKKFSNPHGTLLIDVYLETMELL